MLRPAAIRVLSLVWSSVERSVLVTLRVLLRYPPRVNRVQKAVPK